MQADEQLVQPVRIDLPPHLGALGLGDVDRDRPRRIRPGANDGAAVVVDAEEVEWRRDHVEVAVADPGEERS